MEKRSKIPRIERAKQFAPFDALKGLGLALRKEELKHEQEVAQKIKHENFFDDIND